MNHKTHHYFFTAICIFCFTMTSCNLGSGGHKITVKNNSELNRSSETIEIDLTKLPKLVYSSTSDICVTDEAEKRILSQLIDDDSDSKYLIFQSDFAAGETKHFTITVSDQNPAMPEVSGKTFCRIVPERMDDFAWENDKVAFRTYGPAIQKAFEDGNPGGLISSGIDCWLKRVDYPIIDKWYKKEQSGGSYHQDDGEGLDNYHVGTTRGCGGTAIIEDGKYILSQNFSKWKVITNGPIRSIFEFEYPSYSAGSKTVMEKKRFTIDLGSNLYHCAVRYDCNEAIQEAGIGIAHHNANGVITSDTDSKYLTYWEALGDSYLGTALLLDSRADLKPLSDGENNWINVEIADNTFSYWAGFGWKKAGRFSSLGDWNNYVSEFSAIQRAPLSLKIK